MPLILLSTGGRLLNGATGIATSQGWTPGVTNSYLLLGWSAAVAGMDVASVKNELCGAILDQGCWYGGGLSNPRPSLRLCDFCPLR